MPYVPHTASPWRWNDAGTTLVTTDDEVVLAIDLPEFVFNEDKHLIAAAPDLLAALKAALDYWEATGFAECEKDCDCVVDMARAAIAKAEGGK